LALAGDLIAICLEFDIKSGAAFRYKICQKQFHSLKHRGAWG